MKLRAVRPVPFAETVAGREIGINEQTKEIRNKAVR